jgi:hypothetical protein
VSPHATGASGNELAPLIDDELRLRPIMQALMLRRTELINELTSQVDGLDLEQPFSSLSIDSVDRIARAPLFAAFLGSDMPFAERRAMLSNWLLAERLRVSLAPRHYACWTALGDVFLATDPRDDEFAASAGGLLVDARSPLAQELPFLPKAQRGGAAVAAEPLAACVALQDALELVYAIDAATYAFVTSALTAIVIYDTPVNPKSFSSSSSRSFAGAAMISNVLGGHVDRYRLADAIVHEAVHAYLYAVEAHAPLVYPARRVEPSITSPWTGALLPLHAFTHACFVWLALLRFWSEATCKGDLLQSRAEHFRIRALRGFVQQRLDAPLSAVCPAVPAAAADALLQVNAAARRLV